MAHNLPYVVAAAPSILAALTPLNHDKTTKTTKNQVK
jgi:hypothetical protein